MPPVTSKLAPTPSAAASAVPDITVRAVEVAATPAAVHQLSDMLLPAFDAAFLPFAHVVLAVSGGADSTALMYLAAEWRTRRLQLAMPPATTEFSVVTIDHALRPASATEAAEVARVATALSFRHTTLRWEGVKPKTGVQARARSARYDLLRQHALMHGYRGIAAAHTADDQAETVLMRLARGSGIDGLAAMRKSTPLGDGLVLVRPLIEIDKMTLVDYLRGQGHAWSEDPSNASPAFERVRVRAALSAWTGAGVRLDATALGRSAARAARASDALSNVTRRLWQNRTPKTRFDPLGYAVVDLAWLQTEPEDLRLRLLSGLVAAIGGQESAVSLGQLEALTIGRNWLFDHAVTLHGTRWDRERDGSVRICREPGRRPPAILPVVAGSTVLWDRRFVITAAAQCPPGLTVGSLGAAGVATLERAGWLRPAVPARVLWTLPAIAAGGCVLAVPPLDCDLGGLNPFMKCTPVQPWFGVE